MAPFCSPSRAGARAVLIIVLLAFACARPITERQFRAAGGVAVSVFFVNYGWHSSIVIKKADIATGDLPEVRDFPDGDYLEVGWGDWDYYQAPDPGLGLALKAAFWSSRSVLHVAGFKGAVENHFRGTEIVEIVLSDEAALLLIRSISATFLRPDGVAPVETRPGLIPNSRFYPAKGKFHLFRTCNTWVAEGFRAAGLPVSPAYAFTAGNLSYQIKQFGSVVRDP